MTFKFTPKLPPQEKKNESAQQSTSRWSKTDPQKTHKSPEAVQGQFQQSKKRFTFTQKRKVISKRWPRRTSSDSSTLPNEAGTTPGINGGESKEIKIIPNPEVSGETNPTISSRHTITPSTPETKDMDGRRHNGVRVQSPVHERVPFRPTITPTPFQTEGTEFVFSGRRNAKESQQSTNGIREVGETEQNFSRLQDLPSPEQALADAAKTITAKTNIIDSTVKIKLGKGSLIEDHIVHDDSQVIAIKGLVAEMYGCVTGAAGTGKTTCLKAVIQELEHGVASVNLKDYFAKKGAVASIPEEEGEKESRYIPSIALCAFTGQASQMIKKNFPPEWHPNIMTIHRLLHFVPVYHEVMGLNGIENKMRFEPTFNAGNKLPWDVVIIDESGMLGLDLWEQLFAAFKQTTRVYMVGDINQLPPVHGSSIFGYAMAQWPSYELTHIHRQVGVDNPIVDNAWRILRGERPIPHKDFQMLPLDPNTNKAGRMLQQAILALHRSGKFSSEYDTAIVATNGEEQTQKHFPLGQYPNNSALARILNDVPMDQRMIIDAGRSRKEFAVGDKVMATQNDHEVGVTNGMTGFIREVNYNGQYTGDSSLVGKVEDVNEAMSRHVPDAADLEQSLQEMLEMDEDITNDIYRGQASHSVTIEFTSLGINRGITRTFSTYSEVDSLQHAYLVTCHKSQGAEYPLVIIAIHDCVKSMMTREWLYTAVTRASKQVLLLYTEGALNKALRTQKITGATLAEKVQKFIALGKSTLLEQPNLQTARKAVKEDG